MVEPVNPVPSQNQPQPTLLDKIINAVFQIAIFLFAMTLFRGITTLFSDKTSVKEESTSGANMIWPLDAKYNFTLYCSKEKEFDANNSVLLWKTEVLLGSFEDEESKTNEFEVEVQGNELWLHAWMIDEATQRFIHKTKNVIALKPLKKTKNLLFNSEKNEKDDQVASKNQLVPHLQRNVTISLVSEDKLISTSGLPIFININFVRYMDKIGYYPILYFNDFWVLREHYSPIEEGKTKITVQLQPISFFKYQIMSHLDESFKQQSSMALSDGAEFDDIKRMFSETSPILIAITFAVSILHSLFDFLAFKNDIQFWKNRKNLEGLSVRSIMINAVSQGIIFLYLLDQETSWLVLVSVFIGLVIEIWKIKKAVIFEWKRLGWIRFQDRSSYSNKTKEYDEQAVRYLSYVALPLLIGYSIYSLMYNEHKGWYSFVVGTLVGYVYAFGFIMMTPQLFINYKLKSVAHMPWKAFMYKALNTFVDDLFAFVIKMPLLHRLACFRDDVLFFVYLYQRWIYPVDKKRINEYGQQGEEDKTEKTD